MMSQYPYDSPYEYDEFDTGEEPVANLPVPLFLTGQQVALRMQDEPQPEQTYTAFKYLAVVSSVALLIGAGYLIRDTRLTERIQFYAGEYWQNATSITIASRQEADAEADKVGIVPIQANELFENSGKKGPRADHFLTAVNHPQRPQVILASLAAAPERANPSEAPYRAGIRGTKSNRWQPGNPFDGVVEVAKAETPASGPVQGNRQAAGVFFASALGVNSVESRQARVQTASMPSPSTETGWEHLLTLARVSPQDATLLGGVSETEFRNRELHCLATAIYFEARDEPIQGQIAVGQVIINRVNSPYYPKSICAVVYEGAMRRTGCQFSFTCDGKSHRTSEKKEWETAMEIAKQVLDGKLHVKAVGNATHYHATYVHPAWRKLVKRVTQVGTHIFYTAPFADPSITYNYEDPDEEDRAGIKKVREQIAQSQQAQPPAQPAKPAVQTAAASYSAPVDNVENAPAQVPQSGFGFNGQ
jgi:hypothetical protein